MPEEQKRGLITRRRFLTALGVIGAGILTAEIAGRLYLTSKKEEFEKTYGTVDNPKYPITAAYTPIQQLEDLEEKFGTEKEYEEKQESLIFADKTITTHRKNLERKLDRNEALDGYTETSLILIYLDIEHDRRKYETERLSLALNAYPATHDKIDGFNPRETALKIFYGLTGKQLPETRFVEEEQSPGVAGHHSPLEGIISSRGQKNLTELETLLHEMGHATAQHGEQNLWKKTPDVRALEEACAYAMQNAGIHKLCETNPEESLVLKVQFEAEMQWQTEEFFNGDTDCHSAGAAYFLATRRALKNAYETYNTLARIKDSKLDNLPPEIKAELEKMRTKHQSIMAYKEKMDSKLKELEAIKKEYQKLEKD